MTVEIPFVFNHLDACPGMVGAPTPAMRALETAAAGAWVALARDGKPGHRGLPAWPAYTPDRRAVMIFDTPSRVVRDPTGDVRQIIDRRGASTNGPF
jgi:para-nitrobenzyl esterase